MKKFLTKIGFKKLLIILGLIYKWDDITDPEWKLNGRGNTICFIGAVLAAILTACVISGTIERLACHQQGEMTERQVQYRFLTGCYIKVGNKYVPEDEFRMRAITNEN